MRRSFAPAEATNVPQARHFASLREALAAGRVEKGNQIRRVISGLSETSGLSWSEMAKIGNASVDETLALRRLSK